MTTDIADQRRIAEIIHDKIAWLQRALNAGQIERSVFTEELEGCREWERHIS